jgi:hypothetical protein
VESLEAMKLTPYLWVATTEGRVFDHLGTLVWAPPEGGVAMEVLAKSAKSKRELNEEIEVGYGEFS